MEDSIFHPGRGSVVVMPITYKATLHGNQLKWNGGRPQILPEDQPIPVQVTVLQERLLAPAPNSDSGQRMANALEKIAQLGTFPQDVDPLDWEREQRQDRPLPDRES